MSKSASASSEGDSVRVCPIWTLSDGIERIFIGTGFVGNTGQCKAMAVEDDRVIRNEDCKAQDQKTRDERKWSGRASERDRIRE